MKYSISSSLQKVEQTKITNDMATLHNRCAHSPEDLKDILERTISHALTMVGKGVPLKITEEELIRKKENLRIDRSVFEVTTQQEQSEIDDSKSELV